MLALLLAVEGGMRVLEPRLSMDVRHIRVIPQVVSTLAAAPGEHLLFLGNSMTRRGVDLDVLEPALAARGVAEDTFSVGLIYPDASNVLDWHYVYRRYLSAPGAAPDVMVVGFAAEGLEDVPPDPQQVRRVARHHTSLADVPEVFAHDFTTIAQRGEFLISKAFVSFAHRERVRVRVFDWLIPFYEETERDINRAQGLAAQSLAPALAPAQAPGARYTHLKRFLDSVDTAAVEVIFVAMPLRDPYPLDPGLAEVLEAEGAELLDLRSVPGLSDAAFADALHLAPEGAVLYSRALARKLAPLLGGPASQTADSGAALQASH